MKGLGNANALVMRGLEGPTEVVNRGEDIFLYCRYDLEQNDRLYAVKWFHGAREFYRFQPEMNPPGRVFPIEHIDVDVHRNQNIFQTLHPQFSYPFYYFVSGRIVRRRKTCHPPSR